MAPFLDSSFTDLLWVIQTDVLAHRLFIVLNAALMRHRFDP